MAKRLTLMLAALAFAAGARAQGLNDPTRPPTVSASAPEAAADAAASQLQSVLIAPGRRLAIINGQTVALGGRVGDATLTQITETGVVLKRGDLLESLPLLPGIAKQPARPARASKGEQK